MPPTHSLVVGGTKGVGRAFAERAAAGGQAVSVFGRTRVEASDASAVRAWSVDLTDQSALTAALEDVRARQGMPSSVVLFQRYRSDGDDWAGEIATTLSASRQIIEWVGDRAAASAPTSIVAVGSAADRFVASEQPVSYHMAKAALAQMVRYYAVQLGPAGVRVNGISSGTIVKEESRGFYADHPDLVELYRKIVPLGRMCTADDIVDVVMFLCSPHASFITGQHIVVDGGVSLAWHESLARRLSPLKDLPITRGGKSSS